MTLDMLMTKTVTGRVPGACCLDVGADLLPDEFKGKKKTVAEDIMQYNRAVISAVCDIFPAVAINISALMPYGLDVLSDAFSYAKEKGMYTIADAKSSGDSSSAEATLYYDVFDADCVTVNPYFGEVAVSHFIKRCKNGEKALLVVAHTPDGAKGVQELMAGLRPVYRVVCEKTSMWGSDTIGAMGYSNIGVMLGGLTNAQITELRRAYKKLPFVLTGYNGKDVTASDINGAFDMKGLGGLVLIGREVTLAEGDGEFAARIASAAEKIKRDLSLCF